ncbi:MAG TPA: glyoxylate/hydroxypyruvate reductase A [Actinocrinis sp.]|jgi:glyoxylate/hydroxypyruvate reductase A|nr:glyoxylate/hydroxypyruvate reductase A [Actinocrinis sp.]
MSGEAILVAVDGPNAGEWVEAFRAQDGGRPVRVWPHEIGAREDIGVASVWRAPHGLLATLPNLKLIVSLAAGVDHLLTDPSLPDVPIVRAADPDLSMRVTEYVVLHTLRYHRRQPLYDAQQRQQVWHVHPQPAASEVAVGVMGLGVIGGEAARVLARIGFKVAGWSASAKAIDGVETFHGAAGLDAFLARTEILICLLPLTAATTAILDRTLFAKLKRDGAAGGAFLINAGRGRLQVDADILAALDDGTLAGATLDVFPQEPLPPESPMWTHPNVTVTPHNAGDILPDILAAQVMQQIGRLERGEPLRGLVDRTRGY